MWKDREFLICAKTYPEYSSKHLETVCTAAILKDTKEFIRLYPLPYRYLVGDQQFTKYQWVKATIKKNMQDNRPESYNIKANSIRVGNILPPGRDWTSRNLWILANPKHVFSSLEALQSRQIEDGTSIGLIKPRNIHDFHIETKTKAEIKEEEEKKKNILAQRSFLIVKKELDLIPYRFLLSFKCQSNDCAGHNISILDWEVGQLYRNLINKGMDWKQKIESKVYQICEAQRDLYLFMGNMAARRKTFCILGFYYPPKISGLQLNMYN